LGIFCNINMACRGDDRKMNNEPLEGEPMNNEPFEREPIDRMRARLERYSSHRKDLAGGRLSRATAVGAKATPRYLLRHRKQPRLTGFEEFRSYINKSKTSSAA
jgi:hypothetical protein